MWFISFSRAVTVENCHNSTIVLGVTKTAVNVIGCDSCSFFAVCDRVSIRFVLIPSHGSTQLTKCAQLLLWNIVESLRSGNDNEDEYEFCPREVWYFVFALVLVSTQFVSFDWKKKNRFAFFTLVFYVLSREKFVLRPQECCMRMTHLTKETC